MLLCEFSENFAAVLPMVLRGGGSIADFYLEHGISEEHGFGICEWLEMYAAEQDESDDGMRITMAMTVIMVNLKIT